MDGPRTGRGDAAAATWISRFGAGPTRRSIPAQDAPAAAQQLKDTVGVVDHGFFIGMTTAVIIAGQTGISVKTA